MNSIIIFICLSIFNAAVIYAGLSQLRSRKNDDQFFHIVRIYVLHLLAGIILSGVMMLLELLVLLLGAPTWFVISVGLFQLMANAIIIAYVNCVITYNDDYFVTKSFFRTEHRYRYSDVTGLIHENDSLVLCLRGHRISIHKNGINVNKFINTVMKHYEVDGVHAILPELKHKLFNDNVYHPGEFIFVFILLGILTVFLDGIIYFCVSGQFTLGSILGLLGINICCDDFS